MDPSVDRRGAGRRHLDLHPAAAEGARGGLRGADRDAVPRPRHQPGVRLERRRSGVRRLHRRPLEHRLDPRRHAGPGRGHLRGVTPVSARRCAAAGALHSRSEAGAALATAVQAQVQNPPASLAEREDRPSPAVRRTRPLGRAGDGRASRRSCTSGWSGSRRSPRSCSRSRTGRGSGSATSTGWASRITSRSSPSSRRTSSRR